MNKMTIETKNTKLTTEIENKFIYDIAIREASQIFRDEDCINIATYLLMKDVMREIHKEIYLYFKTKTKYGEQLFEDVKQSLKGE